MPSKVSNINPHWMLCSRRSEPTASKPTPICEGVHKAFYRCTPSVAVFHLVIRSTRNQTESVFLMNVQYIVYNLCVHKVHHADCSYQCNSLSVCFFLFHACAQMLARHMTPCLMRRSGGCTTNTGSRGCRECPHTARINRSSMVRRYSSVCYCGCVGSACHVHVVAGKSSLLPTPSFLITKWLQKSWSAIFGQISIPNSSSQSDCHLCCMCLV